MKELLIGVDIGGTNIVCGLIDEEGRLLSTLKRPTETYMGFEFIMDKVAEMIFDLLSSEKVDIHDVVAVGIGTPGYVDPIKGVTKYAGNLKWRNVPVAEEVSKRVSMPVYVDNDVRMYVYGEAKAGAGKGFQTILGITVGTGLAAAVVHQGQLYYGGNYMAGEVGHIPMNEISYPCVCGLTGCLETIASATGIVRQVKDYLQAGRSSLLQDVPPDQMSSAHVSKAYDAGDKLAIEIMNKTGRLLGKGLASAITLFSPEIVVIGGGVAAAGDRFMNPMREEIRRSIYEGQWSNLTITTAQHLEYAGIIGSAMFAKERLRAV
jgi:glucokinase